jgi:hypothetical protein
VPARSLLRRLVRLAVLVAVIAATREALFRRNMQRDPLVDVGRAP